MTKGEIKQITRWTLDELPVDWFPEADVTRFDLNTAFRIGYNYFAQHTNAFRADYDRATLVDESVIALSSFGALNEGERIYEITRIEVDSRPLEPVTVADLNNFNPRWRSDTAGTPHYWCWWSPAAKEFRVWRPTTAGLLIYVEGFEYPDPATYALDNDVIPVSDVAAPTIALAAAILPLMRLTTQESLIRESRFYTNLMAGIADARKQYHSPPGAVAVGSHSQSRHALQPITNRIIPQIP